MDVTSTTDTGSADEATLLAATFVAKVRTEHEAQFHGGLRGRLASQSQAFARRCAHDGHDGCPCLGRRAVWSMRSEGQTTYSTAGPDGGQHALPSRGESARAVYRCGRFEGGLPLVQLRGRDLRGHRGATLDTNASAIAGRLLGAQRHHRSGLRHPPQGSRHGADRQRRGLGFSAAFGTGGQRGRRSDLRPGGPADSLSQARPETGELDTASEARPGIGAVGTGHRSSRAACGRGALGACDGPRSRQLRGVLPLPATAGGLGRACHAETTRCHCARRTDRGIEAIPADIAFSGEYELQLRARAAQPKRGHKPRGRRSQRGRRRWMSVSGR